MLTSAFDTAFAFVPVVINRRSWPKVRSDRKPTVVAERLNSFVEFEEREEPGLVIFFPSNVRMWFRCPACAQPGSLPLCGVDGQTRWSLTGSAEKPTLTPAIEHDVPECGWQGFLRDGVFEG